MRFQEAVANSKEVRNGYRVGLQALSERDRNRLSFDDTRKITGSLNLDVEVARLYPNETRWDYGIGIRKTEESDRAIWLEVHPAGAGDIQTMIAKQRWLKVWLRDRARDLMIITEDESPYIWVASGGVSFQKTSPHARKLALAGIRFPREHYHVETK